MAKPVARSGEYVPLVEVWRGDLLESIHHGAIVAVDHEGTTLAAAGDADLGVVLRSTAKPVQILPLLESGAASRFGFSDEEIAVMIGSHGGEPAHVAAVKAILERVGLTPSALRCGSHPPYHAPSARALREAGVAPSPLHNNCSGKHAGMLALSVHLGAPVGGYLEASHPVQESIREALATLAGVPAGRLATAIDGCSAPTFLLPLRALALVYARLVRAAAEAAPETGQAKAGPRRGGGVGGASGAAGRWTAAAARALVAMRRHPEMIGGTDRLCTGLMRTGKGGLVAKIGAEGVFALAFEAGALGVGVVLKIADGDGRRARSAAVVEALRQLGALAGPDAARLAAAHVPAIRTHLGAEVGRVAPSFDLGRRVL